MNAVHMSENESPAARAERIRDALEKAPAKMTLQLAHELGVPEVEIVRALPAGKVQELDGARWEEIVRSLDEVGTLHVIVSNGAATLEAVGEFGGFSTWNEFFNVQTKSLDLHLRWPQLGAVLAVEKPSHMNGVPTLSLQFFDRSGAAALKVFFNFGDRPTAERAARFAEIRERLRCG